MEDNNSPHWQYDDIFPGQQPDKKGAPQQPSIHSDITQPVPDEQSQSLDASQRLVLPGQQPPASSFYSDTTQTIGPVPSPQPPPLNQAPNQLPFPGQAVPPSNSAPARKWKLSAMVAWTLVAVLVSTLLFFFTQSALGALGTQRGQGAATHSPVTAVNHAPSSGSYSAPNTNGVPVQTVGTVAITPGNIQVTKDCAVDNGYRCTITLIAAHGQNSAQSWQAETPDLKTKFHPQMGTLQPGQQQQIILYVYNQCPYTGQMVFTVGGSTTSVPLQC
jgi:hypothetical protein